MLNLVLLSATSMFCNAIQMLSFLFIYSIAAEALIKLDMCWCVRTRFLLAKAICVVLMQKNTLKVSYHVLLLSQQVEGYRSHEIDDSLQFYRNKIHIEPQSKYYFCMAKKACFNVPRNCR